MLLTGGCCEMLQDAMDFSGLLWGAVAKCDA